MGFHNREKKVTFSPEFPSKERSNKLINNFFKCELSPIKEETFSQVHKENEQASRPNLAGLALTPGRVIYQSTLTAYNYLEKYDYNNFRYYKPLFVKELSNYKRFKNELSNLIENLTLQDAELSDCFSCGIFSWFRGKDTSKKDKSLTATFINAFLEIDSIDNKEAVQKYLDVVNELITGEFCLTPTSLNNVR